MDVQKAEIKTDHRSAKAGLKLMSNNQWSGGMTSLSIEGFWALGWQVWSAAISIPLPLLPVQRLLVGTIFHLPENQQPRACRAVKPATLHVHTETSLTARLLSHRHLALLNFVMWLARNSQDKCCRTFRMWRMCVPVTNTVQWQETGSYLSAPSSSSFFSSSRLSSFIKQY